MFTNSQMRYMMRESLGSFAKMKGISVISVLIMSVALMMLALFTLVTVNLQGVAYAFRNEIEVVAFLDGQRTNDEINGMRERILQQRGVLSVSFISKEEALDEFRQQLGEDRDLLEVLEENPLPASLRIHVDQQHQNTDKLDLLASWLREIQGIEDVRYGDQWVQRLEDYIHVFLLLDILVGVIVVVSALFVISNTVKLTVMARERSIEIMRLVGATDWFIRTPFLMEGMLQGGMAAAIAMGILWSVHHYASGFVGPLVFYDGAQVAGFIALCAIVSGLGCLTSLRRFLKI